MAPCTTAESIAAKLLCGMDGDGMRLGPLVLLKVACMCALLSCGVPHCARWRTEVPESAAMQYRHQAECDLVHCLWWCMLIVGIVWHVCFLGGQTVLPVLEGPGRVCSACQDRIAFCGQLTGSSCACH
jgi:hypothetical protein